MIDLLVEYPEMVRGRSFDHEIDITGA